MISVVTHIDYEPDRTNWHRFYMPTNYVREASDWLMMQAIGSSRFTLGFYSKFEEEENIWDERGAFIVLRIEEDRDAVLFKMFHSDNLLSEDKVVREQKFWAKVQPLFDMRNQGLISQAELDRQVMEIEL